MLWNLCHELLFDDWFSGRPGRKNMVTGAHELRDWWQECRWWYRRVTWDAELSSHDDDRCLLWFKLEEVEFSFVCCHWDLGRILGSKGLWHGERWLSFLYRCWHRLPHCTFPLVFWFVSLVTSLYRQQWLASVPRMHVQGDRGDCWLCLHKTEKHQGRNQQSLAKSLVLGNPGSSLTLLLVVFSHLYVGRKQCPQLGICVGTLLDR